MKCCYSKIEQTQVVFDYASLKNICLYKINLCSRKHLSTWKTWLWIIYEYKRFAKSGEGRLKYFTCIFILKRGWNASKEPFVNIRKFKRHINILMLTIWWIEITQRKWIMIQFTEYQISNLAPWMLGTYFDMKW